MSLRLYGRGRGPADICATLNEHRHIHPPYLRNTCSVKCVTAQRRGVERYGEQWCDRIKAAFAQVDDAQATRMLEVKPDDGNDPEDIDVLTLCRGLKKHPEMPNNPGVYGIFAQCVMWCEEHNQSWMLSQIHEVAIALQAGRDPIPNVTMETTEIMSFLNDNEEGKGEGECMNHGEMAQSSSQISSVPSHLSHSGQEEHGVGAHENSIEQLMTLSQGSDAMVDNSFGGQLEV